MPSYIGCETEYPMSSQHEAPMLAAVERNMIEWFNL